jgi:uncharacterized protein
MRIAVISDTHGHVPNTRAAVHILDAFDVQAVLHCGDIGSADVVPLLAGWPTHFVLGNVDGGYMAGEIEAAIKDAGQTCHGRFGALELAGVKIGLLHGDDDCLLRQTIADEKFDLICHGHTHRQRWEKVGKTQVLNPGALFRANPHSIAVVELPALQAEFITV